MNIKEKINRFLDKYELVEREDDVEFICNYEKLNSIILNEKQIKFVNKLIQKRNIDKIIASTSLIFIMLFLYVFNENKTNMMYQTVILLFFVVVGIVFSKKYVKELKEENNSDKKAYLGKVIEKDLVRSAGSSSGRYVVRVLFEHNQKDFVSLEHKFARKINVGDRIIVVKTNNHLYAIPYDYLIDDIIR